MLSQRALEAFQAVMTTGSVSAAAGALAVSQPAVSRLLRDLETRTGLVLFTRLGNRVIPTDAARALMIEIERSFIGLSAIEAAARQIARGVHGAVSVAAMPALSLTVLPDVIASLGPGFDESGVEIQSARTHNVVRLVARQQAALGFVAPLRAIPEIAVLAEDAFAYRCIMTADHPLADRDVIELADLADRPFVTFSAATATGRRLERLFARMPQPPRIRARAHLSSVISALALRGTGVAVVDPFTARDHEARGGRSLPVAMSERFGVTVIAPPGAVLSPGAERLYAGYREVARTFA
ncbi:MAG: LysR substrate-binding domain-containing protein [Pseudomonadota bacterium]